MPGQLLPTAVVLPKEVYEGIIERIENLEQMAKVVMDPPKTNKLLTVKEAASRLHMTPEGVRKARRQGRLTGKRINEKEWGFYELELDRCLHRYNRDR